MKNFTLMLLAMAGMACSSTALAGNEGWYVLGGMGQSTSNNDKSQTDASLIAVGYTGFRSVYTAPTIYKLQAGYQLDKHLAVEGGYVGSGTASYSATGGSYAGIPMNANATSSIQGLSLALVGILPINDEYSMFDQFSLIGKIGVASIRGTSTATVSSGAVAVSTSASGTVNDFTYGLGAQYYLTQSIFARLDLDNYKTGDSTASGRGSCWTFNLGFKM
jgi:opacity protein-like surface antigen